MRILRIWIFKICLELLVEAQRIVQILLFRLSFRRILTINLVLFNLFCIFLGLLLFFLHLLLLRLLFFLLLLFRLLFFHLLISLLLILLFILVILLTLPTLVLFRFWSFRVFFLRRNLGRVLSWLDEFRLILIGIWHGHRRWSHHNIILLTS